MMDAKLVFLLQSERTDIIEDSSVFGLLVLSN